MVILQSIYLLNRERCATQWMDLFVQSQRLSMSTFSSSSPSSDLMKRRKCEGRCDSWQNSLGLLGMIVYLRLVTMPRPMKLQFQITLSGTMKKPRNFSDSSSWHFSQQAPVKAAGLGFGLAFRNSQPLRVSLQAVSERLPGVKATLSTMLLSTAQLLFSLRNLVCMSASATPSWFFSSGEVWIQPNSSYPFRNCDSGIWYGTVMPSLEPTCGTSTMVLISRTAPSMVTPQRQPMIWILRSEMQTNFLRRFLGMMQVKPLSLMSSELVQTLLVRMSMLVAERARSRQSVCDLNCACSQLVVVVVVMRWFWSLVVCTVTVAPSCAFASTFCRCSFCTFGGGSSIPRMISLIYSCVRLATFTLFFFAQSLITRFFISTSTFIHSSSVSVGQMWLGLVTIVLLGFMMPFVLSTFTCSDRRISISREKAVKDDTDFSHSSYRLYSTICGSDAFRISSANFSILREDWKGSCRSLPLITMLGKSSRCTSSGSSMPFRVTITCRGRSSGGRARMSAATSSAVFHLASCPRRFWPAQTLVWMTLRKSWPVRGLKMKMAPLMGLVVRLPSKVLWMVTRQTLVSSTNQMTWLVKRSVQFCELRQGSVGSEEQSCRPLRMRSRSTQMAGLAFMILLTACSISVLLPGNQLPKAECMLYAMSIATRQPVGDGQIEMLSVVQSRNLARAQRSMSWESKSPQRSCTSIQYLLEVVPSQSSLFSWRRQGLLTCHLQAAKRMMSAQEEFILQLLRGWMVSFCTVSISRLSSSMSNTWHRSITTLSWIFCHRCARKIWISEIFRVGIFPCMKMPVRSSCTWKPMQTFARFIVGDHHSVNRRLGIWLRPERWACVSFLNFIDSSKPEAFSQKRPSQVGKQVPLKSVCSRMPSTPPSAWIMSVRQLLRFQSLPSCFWCVHQKGFCLSSWYCLNSCRTRQPLSYASVSRSFWNRVFIRGMPWSQLSYRSSSVSRRFCAFASCRFIAYSAHTRWLSTNSESQVWMQRYRLGMSWSSSCDIPALKCVMPCSVCLEQRRSAWGMRIWPIESMPSPPSSLGVQKTTGGNLLGILELRPILILVCILFSDLTSRSSISSVWMMAYLKQVMSPMRVVFHLLEILVKVVEPLAMSIWRTRFSKRLSESSSMRMKALAVISLVISSCSFHTPSFCVNSSFSVRTRGSSRTSNPQIENSRLGLSREQTETQVFSQWMVVMHRGSRFLISQKTLRPRLTSCFMRRMRQSLGQHLRLLQPTTFSLLGSGFSVRQRWMSSRASSLVNLKRMQRWSTQRRQMRMGCLVSSSMDLQIMNSFSSSGGPAISLARLRPMMRMSMMRPQNWKMKEVNWRPMSSPQQLVWFISLKLMTTLFLVVMQSAMLWSTISRSSRFSSVRSIFSQILSSRVCISTSDCSSLQSHTPCRLFIPWQYLYSSSGGGQVSLGFIQFGNSRLLSAQYHKYWSRQASVIFSSGSISQVGIRWLYRSMNESETSLNTRCVSRCRFIRDSVSQGLSQACSTSASSSFCDWFRRDLTEYASLSLSRARVRILVSCLQLMGGNGMWLNLRASSQCTSVVQMATPSSAEMQGPSLRQQCCRSCSDLRYSLVSLPKFFLQTVLSTVAPRLMRSLLQQAALVHQSAFCLMQRRIMFSIAPGMPGTFQGMLAFQHLQASAKCCMMVLALLALIPSGIMSIMSFITAALSSKSQCDSARCFVTTFTRPFECLPSNVLASRLPNHLSSKGMIPLMKKSQTLHPGVQIPTPGPLPTGPVLKRQQTTCLASLHILICLITRYLYRQMPVSWPTCAQRYWRPSASWKASTLPSLNWTLQSTTSLTILKIYRQRWKAFPNLDRFLSLVVRVLTGLRLKLQSRCRQFKFLRWMSSISMLKPCRHSCRPASTQSSSVNWKNLVLAKALSRLRFFCAFGFFLCSSFFTQVFSIFWQLTLVFTGQPVGQRSFHQPEMSGMSYALLVFPHRWLKGLGAQSKAMPLDVSRSQSGSSSSRGAKSSPKSISSSSSSSMSYDSVKKVLCLSILYAVMGLMEGSKLKVGISGSSCLMQTVDGWWYSMRATLLGLLLQRCGKAILYSVLMGWRTMILLMSLNSFQSSSKSLRSRKSGSNLGPPGMATLRALAVKKDLRSKRQQQFLSTMSESSWLASRWRLAMALSGRCHLRQEGPLTSLVCLSGWWSQNQSNTALSSRSSSSMLIGSSGSISRMLSPQSSGASSSSKGGKRIRLKCLRSRFSLLIMIHIVPHCAVQTGSITLGTSSTKVMAPVMWQSTRTVRTCSQGMGTFSSSLQMPCGAYLSEPKKTRLSVLYFRPERSVWSLMILRRISGGRDSFCASTNPCFFFSEYFLLLNCRHLRAFSSSICSRVGSRFASSSSIITLIKYRSVLNFSRNMQQDKIVKSELVLVHLALR